MKKGPGSNHRVGSVMDIVESRENQFLHLDSDEFLQSAFNRTRLKTYKPVNSYENINDFHPDPDFLEKFKIDEKVKALKFARKVNQVFEV